jgi:N-acetylglucosaminyldiphosphoundecaprenol N-acetyl-beta-D-mannosaminyltransferase
VLGVRVAAVTLAKTCETIQAWIGNRSRKYICVTGVHGVIESFRNNDLKDIHNAGMPVPDGMPLVWVGWAQGHGKTDRVYGPDLMLSLCDLSQQHGYGHFFYGGGPGVCDRLVNRLRDRYPALAVVGTHTPPFSDDVTNESEDVIGQINRSGADVVWVGLSTPKQERWMAAHRSRLNAPVLIGVGAAFDFHAGLKPQAPRWMQRSGLEWLFRLGTEPRRLWRRYLRNNPLFLFHIALQLTRLRQYE